MFNYTFSLGEPMCNITTPPPPFLPIATSTSFCAISNDLPEAENILSSCCNTKTGEPDQLIDDNNQTSTSKYDVGTCAWRYCNVTDQSAVKSFKSCINRASPTDVKGKCFGPSVKVVTSGSSINWRGGKKKKTVSAGLLIALGVAGIVIGG